MPQRLKKMMLWSAGLAVAAVCGLAGWIAIDPEPAKRALVRALSDDYVVGARGPLAPTTRERTPLAVEWKRVASGLTQPTDLQFVPGSDRDAVVLEKEGTARWLDVQTAHHGVLLRVHVLTASEQGLLGLAFHPDFANNRRFFLNYTVRDDGADVSKVVEWTLADARNLRAGGARHVRDILQVKQPYANHNAGQLAFGPDGYLYVGWGDGGFRDDPQGHGQTPSTWLGSMLRIDVSASSDAQPYAVPKDNPFIGRAGYRPETWAFGLRNPWRYSWDPSGRLIVADVGQDTWEEIDIVERGDNLGWNVKEGFACFSKTASDCERSDLVDPVLVYGREVGQSITGGYVYTGTAIPQLSGMYVFADFISGRLMTTRLPQDRTQRVQPVTLGQWPLTPSAFGKDASGELFVASFSRGEVHKLVAGHTAPAAKLTDED